MASPDSSHTQTSERREQAVPERPPSALHSENVTTATDVGTSTEIEAARIPSAHTAQARDANLRHRRTISTVLPPSQSPTVAPRIEAENGTEATTSAHSTNATPQAQAAPRQEATPRDRAVTGAKDLGLITAIVGGTYLLSDNDVVFPFAVVACVVTVSSVLVKYALASLHGGPRGRVRSLHHHRHFCGERAEYVRTNQRLAMMDRDFTAADYEMLLDLDNHSQRFRRFLEGASEETIARLPTFVYKRPEEGDLDCVSEVDAIKHAHNAGTPDGTNAMTEEESILGATEKKCMICLEDFEDGMLIRTLPCLHRFMSECIEPWLSQQAKCPVCKNGLAEGMNSMPPGLC